MQLLKYKILACPRCRNVLTKLNCESCQTVYPQFNGIPFMFAHPPLALIQWNIRYIELLKNLKSQLSSLDRAAANTKPHSTPELRIKAHQQAAENSTQVFERILGLEFKNLLKFLPTDYDSLFNDFSQNKISATQTFESYFPNIFRDWAWTTRENQDSLDFIKQLLPEKFTWGKTAIIGSGASRLSADLWAQNPSELFFNIDLNPFLLSLGKFLLEGQTIELYEVPRIPAKPEWTSVKHQLESKVKPGEQMHFILADILRPPFREKSFQSILTPWLIDIVPLDFRSFCRLMNSLLDESGHWINEGPLSFENQSYLARYTSGEILDILAQEGFKILNSKNQDLNYLCSPYSTQSRRENIFGFVAQKKKHLSYRFEQNHKIPPWLVDTNLKVPVTEKIKAFSVWRSSQAAILGMVDGEKSIEQMAIQFSQHLKITLGEAKLAVMSQLMDLSE